MHRVFGLCLSLAVAPLAGHAAAAKTPPPKPGHANVRYGPHPRNVYDLWLPTAPANRAAPLVLYIHGGGFKGGDKGSITALQVTQFREAGWAVAAINYRLTDTAPAPAAYLDCARALQHLRSQAKRYGIDPRRVASTGGSAGAGTSLWLAFHDDLADPKSADVVARESTRLTCVSVTNAQSSYDPRFAEKIGMPRPNFERHDFFLPFYGITKGEIDTPEAYRKYEMAAPITHLTRDDPPVMLRYGQPNEKVTAATSVGAVVHHPLLGIALKRDMDRLGIECIVQYRKSASEPMIQEPPRERGGLTSEVEFIRKHFTAVR